MGSIGKRSRKSTQKNLLKVEPVCIDLIIVNHIICRLSLVRVGGLFFTPITYEKHILILVYPMRIQSDHSESDRSYSQETLASVPITEKEP